MQDRPTIRMMQAHDDATQVAELIYATDATLFPLLFGKRQKAVKNLVKLIKLENNSFSHKQIAVYDDQGIKGIIIFYTSSELHGDQEFNDFIKAFNLFDLLRLLACSILLFPILNHTHTQGVYIQNICVDGSMRGKGIGTQLIHYVHARYLSSVERHIYLDVAIDNEKARKLYERENFVLVKKKHAWGLFPLTFLMRKEVRS